MSEIISTDFVLQDNLFFEEYLEYVWTQVYQASDRQWLEAPADTAECTGLDPIIDVAPRVYDRGVYGYIAFGTWGKTGRGLFPDNAKAEQYAIWQTMQFINWKHQLFRAPKGCNALRIFARTNNRIYINGHSYSILPGAETTTKVSGPGGAQIWPPIGP